MILNSDSEASLEDVEPDSDDDVKSTHEKGYDSDKDPAWRPHHNPSSQVDLFTMFSSTHRIN